MSQMATSPNVSVLYWRYRCLNISKMMYCFLHSLCISSASASLYGDRQWLLRSRRIVPYSLKFSLMCFMAPLLLFSSCRSFCYPSPAGCWMRFPKATWHLVLLIENFFIPLWVIRAFSCWQHLGVSSLFLHVLKFQPDVSGQKWLSFFLSFSSPLSGLYLFLKWKCCFPQTEKFPSY